MNTDETAHDTQDGYCCACEYDIAVMDDKIREAVALREQEIVKEIKRRLGEPMEPYNYEQKTNPVKQKQREAYNDCHKKVIDILATITKKD